MSLFALIALCGFTPVYAAQSAPASYDTRIEYTVAGEKMHFQTVGLEGKAVTHEFTREDGVRRLEMTPTEAGRGKVDLKFSVSFVSNDGKKKISGKPRIIALEGEEARMDIAPSPGQPPEISLVVVSRRVEN